MDLISLDPISTPSTERIDENEGIPLIQKRTSLDNICARFIDEGWEFTGSFDHTTSYLSGNNLTTAEMKPLSFVEKDPNLTSFDLFTSIFDKAFFELLVSVVGPETVKTRNIG